MNYVYSAFISLFFASFAVAAKPRFCVAQTDLAACQNATGTNFTCVQASTEGCTKDVIDEKADLTLAVADNLVKYEDKLQIVYGQKFPNIAENVKYYGLAVVQKNASFNLNQLQDKKSCHTGVGKTAGWEIPVGYLLSTKQMTFIDNQYKSASVFFGESCAPGIKNLKDVEDNVKTDLCSLCNGTCEYGNSESFSNHQGAFTCMAKGNNDRVGFVKQGTSDAVIAANPGKFGSASDYKLLCKDGTKKDLSQYANCFIGAKPADALVAKNDTPEAMVMEMKRLLDVAGLTKLKAAKMVSSDTESLQSYTGSVKDYVGDYANYYNALSGPGGDGNGGNGNGGNGNGGDGNGGDGNGGDGNAAPSVLISFALQIIAIFAFVLLV